MNPHQKVFRVRRNYNRWVANETLEDYALRFTAKSARRWSAAHVSQTALGAISFLALEAIGGAITLSYGFSNAVTAIMVVGVIIFLTGLPISYHAAKQGTDIDLLTRGAGFGYIGSTITSLIYASFTFIFFALEAAILAFALELTLGIPLTIGYVISSIVVIPLVTHGITLISRFQVWSQPVWILLQIIPLACIAFQSDNAIDLWTSYSPATQTSDFNLLAFGAASAVLFSLIAQIGEQVDFLRFLPKEHTEKPSARWWFAMVAAGPGWIITGTAKILIGSFLAVLALSHGIEFDRASDPNRMYLTAFGYLNGSPQLTLWLTCAFVILSQLKINVTNAYAGSIAWSNFFSRLTHNHPGRVVWVVFNVAIALMLMELGVYRVLEEILGVYSIVALAWVGSLVADLVINKPLGLRPATMEFKRAHLYDINPVGVGSMIIASGLGFASHFGIFGEVAQALSSYIALGSTFVSAPAIAYLTKGKYYIARESIPFSEHNKIECCICNHEFEREDMANCPAYAGPICSLCCSLDSRCHDMCKTESRLSDQLTSWLGLLLPNSWTRLLQSRFGHFIGIFILINLVIASLLLLVYVQISWEQDVENTLISSALVNVFFILFIVSGVVSWMFTLVHEARRVALEETQHQTELLIAEIKAHKETDRELQKAKEVAESANQAKSRYLTGISHELRSPLNAIMGYAQLLEQDSNLPTKRRSALSIIRRSSEYLADLIEGLLDISRIEAGRLELAPSSVQLSTLLEQIVSMFQMQAHNKNIGFHYSRLTPLPDTVKIDEKRLRQILINLLSNAVKYTHEGAVDFSVSYRSQVAVFTIRDTGVGIAEKDMDRVFRPFERVRKAGGPYVAGTGLGLTITNLLIEILGGDIKVNSQPGIGSTFTVSLMLSSTDTASTIPTKKVPTGYEGEEKTLFIVDDEPSHRSLLNDILAPLGFNVLQASDGRNCLEMLSHLDSPPDVFLLDITMPGMSGWSLAQQLRKLAPSASILMISADAHPQPPHEFEVSPHDGYIVKPITIDQLLENIAHFTSINWSYSENGEVQTELTEATQHSLTPSKAEVINIKRRTIDLNNDVRNELIRLAKIGYANGINEKLRQLTMNNEADPCLVKKLQNLSDQFQFAALIQVLEVEA
ncbi:ATP-binding protein [Aurantivibrio plasticivorans]